MRWAILKNLYETDLNGIWILSLENLVLSSKDGKAKDLFLMQMIIC